MRSPDISVRPIGKNIEAPQIAITPAVEFPAIVETKSSSWLGRFRERLGEKVALFLVAARLFLPKSVEDLAMSQAMSRDTIVYANSQGVVPAEVDRSDPSELPEQSPERTNTGVIIDLSSQSNRKRRGRDRFAIAV